MCVKCVRKLKKLKLSLKTKAKTYGQIKALAQKFHKTKVVGMYDKTTNVGVESHLFKIEQALTKKRYKRTRASVKDI